MFLAVLEGLALVAFLGGLIAAGLSYLGGSTLYMVLQLYWQGIGGGMSSWLAMFLFLGQNEYRDHDSWCRLHQAQGHKLEAKNLSQVLSSCSARENWRPHSVSVPACCCRQRLGPDPDW